MADAIDIENSIRTGRVKYTKVNGWRIIDQAMDLVSTTLLITPAGLIIILFSKDWPFDFSQSLFLLIVFALSFIAAFLCLYALFYYNKMIRLKGVASPARFDEFSRMMYFNYDIQLNKNQQIARHHNKPNWWSWERRLLVIIDCDDALVFLSRVQ